MDIIVFLVLVGVASCIVGTALGFYNVRKKEANEIPGLDPVDANSGNRADINEAGGLHQFLVKLHRYFGPIASYWHGREYIVSTASPQLFAAQRCLFNKPARMFARYRPLVGKHSIIYANGAAGSKRREIHDEYFTYPNRTAAVFEMLNKVSTSIIERWEAKSEKEEHIPLREEISYYAYKVILRVVLGDYFEDDSHVLAFKKCFAECTEEMEKNDDTTDLSQDETCKERFDKNLTEVLAIINTVLEQRARDGPFNGNGVFADTLVASKAPREEVISDIITYILQAVTNINYVLLWMFWYLSSNPTVQTRLHKDIIAEIGTDGKCTSKKIAKLRYLLQVIEETIRCAGLGQFTARASAKDVQLGGYTIPAGTTILQSMVAVEHDGNIWPTPKRFDPERFNLDNVYRRHTLSHEPFGFAGGRQCPAAQLAYLEIAVLMSAVMRRFYIHLKPREKGSDEMWLTASSW